eukprot:Hpha_TRINITY_DN15768_c1_g1::TRINITY_DN15768_c1_g1_i6::g.40547::m.40547
MMRSVMLAALLSVGVMGQDLGFELLYTTSKTEFSDQCVTVPADFPAYATGSFIISSTGVFEYNGKNFQGVLDSFGKMHRFEMKGNQVCATYSMLRSGFYNNSIANQEVSHGILFYETDPPRSKCPLLKPLCNLQTTNDNCYVNSFISGGELYTVTDALMMLKLDPSTFAVKESFNFDAAKGMTIPLSTAHPLVHPKTKEVVSYREQMNLTDMKHSVVVYTINGKAEVAANRKDIASTTVGTAPYMHSYGLTMNYAVFPRMPIAVKMDSLSLISKMFQDINLTSDRDINNAFHVVPLNGSAPFVRYLPMSQKLYFVHTVNSYETETGIILDLTTFQSNPFEVSGTNVTAMKDKAVRDAGDRNPVTRFFLPFDETQPVTSKVMSDETMATDFPVINPAFQSRHYCYFWANSWYTGSAAYGDMGIVKYDVCGGSKVPKVWSRDNWYPSEPKMIPSGGAEDEGLVVFTALNGETGETFLIHANATTMATVSEAGPFPRIGFTAHGEFYENGAFA